MTLAEKVQEVAKINVSKYNLAQYAKKRETLVGHCNICKQLVELSKVNNYPISLLVYFAVGTNAHRSDAFDAMYKKIDVKKANTVLAWAKMFAEHNEVDGLRTNQILSHVLAKYYDKVSKKTSDFKKVLKTYEKSSKITDAKKLIVAFKIM